MCLSFWNPRFKNSVQRLQCFLPFHFFAEEEQLQIRQREENTHGILTVGSVIPVGYGNKFIRELRQSGADYHSSSNEQTHTRKFSGLKRRLSSPEYRNF